MMVYSRFYWKKGVVISVAFTVRAGALGEFTRDGEQENPSGEPYNE